MNDTCGDGTDRPMPTDVAGNVRADVAKRIPQMETLRRGSNIPSGMDSYLAGYIDAHYQIRDELETLESLLQQFDKEVRDARLPTCYQCGSELGDDWHHRNRRAEEKGTNPADCPECGENPLPPIGGATADE